MADARASSTVPRRLRLGWIAAALLAPIASLSGCDRGVSRGNLGHVIFTDPQVPGSDVPYPLPQLDEPGQSEPAQSE